MDHESIAVVPDDVAKVCPSNWCVNDGPGIFQQVRQAVFRQYSEDSTTHRLISLVKEE